MAPTESEAKPIEQNRVKSSRLETMEGHNMPDGFARSKIHATFEGGQEKLVGSFYHGETGAQKQILFQKQNILIFLIVVAVLIFLTLAKSTKKLLSLLPAVSYPQGGIIKQKVSHLKTVKWLAKMPPPENLMV